MDFNTLEPDLLESIKDVDRVIPEEHKMFFEEYKLDTHIRRVSLAKVYKMWMYAVDNNASLVEVAEAFNYLNKVSVQTAFRKFNVKFPKKVKHG